ncbi:hypothetical protein Tco_1068416 [Tanacetum coccineum]|uniref:Uncharacterized protein n=1 Tax=Tanacetum coccineum TaxID=301880 RepID=A0ABQ5HH31_9ASTR
MPKRGGGGGVGMDVVVDVLLVESALFGDDGVDGVNDCDVEGEEWGELMFKDGEGGLVFTKSVFIVVSWNGEGKMFVDEVKIGCGDVESITEAAMGNFLVVVLKITGKGCEKYRKCMGDIGGLAIRFTFIAHEWHTIGFLIVLHHEDHLIQLKAHCNFLET